MAEQPDGTVIKEKTSVDYTLGSDALGRVGKAVGETVTGMKERGVATSAAAEENLSLSKLKID